MVAANVDLTRQRALFTPIPGAPPPAAPVEVWLQDATVRAMWLLKMLRISFEANEPTNFKVLWFDQGNPPTGVPGVLKWHDPTIGAWTLLTPDAFVSYLSIVNRPKIWHIPGDPPVAGEIIVADWLWDETEDRLYFFVPLASGAPVWIDVTGAGIDVDSVQRAVYSMDAGNRLTRGVDGGLFLGGIDAYVTGGSYDVATNKLIMQNADPSKPNVQVDIGALLERDDLQARETSSSQPAPASVTAGTQFVHADGAVDICVDDGVSRYWRQIY